MQKAQWEQHGFQHIRATAREFIDALVEKFASEKYLPETVALPRPTAPVSTQDRYKASSFNPFIMYDTEALAEEDPDKFVRYFIEPVDYSRILDRHNTVLEGHRGSGKSMIFRYLSLFHDHARDVQFPFWGFYVKLESGFFDAVERSTESDSEWTKNFQHYFNLVVATGLLKNLSSAINNDIFSIKIKAEEELVGRIRHRLLQVAADGFGNTLQELCSQLYHLLDTIRNNPQHEVFRTSPSFVERFLEEISKEIPQLTSRWWAILLDEWDNLSEAQQRVVVRRLHDRSGQLRYKIAVKPLEFIDTGIDRIHDYEFVCIDHYLFEKETKAKYFLFLEKVGNKRLEIAGASIQTIRELLPKREGKPSLGYDYSGFESFAMLSSGLVREFLELCKDAVYSSQPEIALMMVPLVPVPVKWQHFAARIHSAIHYNNHRGCSESDQVEKLLNVIGSVFKAIDLATANQKEHRYPLTIEISDSYNVDSSTMKILVECVRNRLLQIPEIPLQPRNPYEGIKKKYIIHRLLCPLFSLSVNSRFSVPIKSTILNTIWSDPRNAIRQLTKNYKSKGIDKYLPKDIYQLSFFQGFEDTK